MKKKELRVPDVWASCKGGTVEQCSELSDTWTGPVGLIILSNACANKQKH